MDTGVVPGAGTGLQQPPGGLGDIAPRTGQDQGATIGPGVTQQPPGGLETLPPRIDPQTGKPTVYGPTRAVPQVDRAGQREAKKNAVAAAKAQKEETRRREVEQKIQQMPPGPMRDVAIRNEQQRRQQEDKMAEKTGEAETRRAAKQAELDRRRANVILRTEMLDAPGAVKPGSDAATQQMVIPEGSNLELLRRLGKRPGDLVPGGGTMSSGIPRG